MYICLAYVVVGHTAKPPEPAQEFQIENEDFPALPGTATTKNNGKYPITPPPYGYIKCKLLELLILLYFSKYNWSVYMY